MAMRSFDSLTSLAFSVEPLVELLKGQVVTVQCEGLDLFDALHDLVDPLLLLASRGVLDRVELLGDGVLDLSDQDQQAILLSIAASAVGQSVSLGFLVSIAQGRAHRGQGLLRCLGKLQVLVSIDLFEILGQLSDPSVIDGENHHHVFECLLIFFHRSGFLIFVSHYFPRVFLISGLQR